MDVQHPSNACQHLRRKPYIPERSTGDESDYESYCLDCGAVLRRLPNVTEGAWSGERKGERIGDMERATLIEQQIKKIATLEQEVATVRAQLYKLAEDGNRNAAVAVLEHERANAAEVRCKELEQKIVLENVFTRSPCPKCGHLQWFGPRYTRRDGWSSFPRGMERQDLLEALRYECQRCGYENYEPIHSSKS